MLAALAWGARPADRVADRNGALYQAPVVTLAPGMTVCQPDPLPGGARRVRVPAEVQAEGLVVRLVLGDGQRRAAGEPAPVRGAIVVPVPRDAPERVTEVCLAAEGAGAAQLLGQPVGDPDRLRVEPPTVASTGRMRVEYLYGGGPQPLWGATLLDLPGRVAGAAGTRWAPWLVALAWLAVIAALVALMRGRRELLAVAALGFASAATWSGFTPLFQASDEQAHAAYVQVFGELGHPPRNRANTADLPPELACWVGQARLWEIRFFDAERPHWNLQDRDPCAGQERKRDAAQYQAAQPPAYYALATVGYELGSALDRPLPDRLLLARLVSALLAAVTVLSVFLFVREAFPRSPWPARGAALATGLQPVMMFNHGSINSDALVFATAAAVAAVLARMWRRGPTLRRALLLGSLLGLGAVAKITFLIVVPLALAVQLLVWLRARDVPLARRGLLLAATGAVALLPPLAYVLLGDAIFEPSVQTEAGIAPPAAGRLQIASYVWQSFLPALPFMEDVFIGGRPPGWYAMFRGPATRLGWWDDYGIASSASKVLALATLGLVLYAIAAAARRRPWRLALAAALGVTGGFCALLVWALYKPGDFQVAGRYMGILMALWGLAAGTVIASLRPHRQGHATALLAVAMLGWTALALEATLSRWYL